jgi:hypothetical protein
MNADHDPLLPVRARADIIKRLLSDAKLAPNALTAAALCFLAMKLLGVKGPDIEEFLSRGPFATLSTLWKKFEETGENPAAAVGVQPAFDPHDPNATITMTQAQLWSMLGNADPNAKDN